jgi:hypothetical protein
MMRTCRRCVFREDTRFFLLEGILPAGLTTDFDIDDDGICSVCRAYAASYNPAHIERDRDWFLSETTHAPVILALSGGKDSLSTLYALKRLLGRTTHALLFDNGFIPAAVKERAQAACDKLAVPLHVARGSDRDLLNFANVVKQTQESACSACNVMMLPMLEGFAAQLGAEWIVTGTNFFNAWESSPRAACHGRVGAPELKWINLPYALAYERRHTLANIEALGVAVVSYAGMSTNCRVPGLLDQRMRARLGYTPERELTALEVLVGHMTREEGLAAVESEERLQQLQPGRA